MPTKRIVAQIEELVETTKPVNPPLPVPRYIGQLIAMAKYWESHEAATKEHPGLEVGKAFTKPYSPDLLTGLAELISEEHTNAILPADGPSAELKELAAKGKAVDEELDLALTTVLDDGVEDEFDKALAVAKTRGTADSSEWTLAQSLKDKAAIAEGLEDKLSLLGDYDKKLADRAQQLGAELGDLAKASSRASAAIARRNVLIGVAEKAVDQLERIARYAFRDAPAILDAMPTRGQFARS